eukprot:1388257-Rhodomonas_salina.1
MSNNPVNPAGSRHIDTRLYFLLDMMWEGVLEPELAKVDVVPRLSTKTRNPADALTKSVSAPMLEKHREYLLGMQTPFQAFMAVVGFGVVAAAA